MEKTTNKMTEASENIRICQRRLGGGFTTVHNAIARHPELSLAAKGLYALIVSLPEDLRHQRPIQKKCGVGRDKLCRIVSELKDVGVIIIKQKRGEKGQFSSSEWILCDPEWLIESQSTDEPSDRKWGVKACSKR